MSAYVREKLAAAVLRVEAAFVTLSAAEHAHDEMHHLRHRYDENNPGHRFVDLEGEWDISALRAELDGLKGAVTAANDEVREALLVHYELAQMLLREAA